MTADTDTLAFFVALRGSERIEGRNPNDEPGGDPLERVGDYTGKAAGIIDTDTAENVAARLERTGAFERETETREVEGALFDQEFDSLVLTKHGERKRWELLGALMDAHRDGRGGTDRNRHLPDRDGFNGNALCYRLWEASAAETRLTDEQIAEISEWCLPECSVEFLSDAELFGADAENEPVPVWVLRATYFATVFAGASEPLTAAEVHERASPSFGDNRTREILKRMADAGMIEVGKRDTGGIKPAKEYGVGEEKSRRKLADLIRRGAWSVWSEGENTVRAKWIHDVYDDGTEDIRAANLNVSTWEAGQFRYAFAPYTLGFELQDPEHVYALGGQKRNPVDSPLR